MFGYMSTVQSAAQFFGTHAGAAIIIALALSRGMILTGLVISLRLIISGLTTIR